MNNTKRLETNRLILRKFTIEDAEAMYRNWVTDPECCKFLPWNVHQNIDETKSIVQKWVNEYENGSYHWVVELKSNHEIIGSISVVRLHEEHKTAEIGYCYGSKFWNHGYATESLRRVLEYLLKECGFYLVECGHISGNPASGRVMQKVGMKKDAVLRERHINKATQERNDLIFYSIKQSEL